MIDNNTPMEEIKAIINRLPEGVDIEIGTAKAKGGAILHIGTSEFGMGEGNLVDDINEALRIIKETGE